MKEWLVKMKRDWTTDNSVLCVWTRDVLGLCFICVTVFIVVYLLFIMSKKRGGHVCAVKNCKNRRYNCDKSFFRFPSDPNRARIWILKCHREDLLENLNSVDKSSRLCEDHFEPRMFTNHLRNRLNKNAVPTLFPSLEGSSKDFSDHAYSQPMLVTSNINILQDMVLCPTDVSENNPVII